MDAKALLLTTAFRHVINEPNIESGFERFATLTERTGNMTPSGTPSPPAFTKA